jgi:hypothetical protein
LINNANFEILSWVTNAPYDIRDAAIIDGLNADQSNFSKKDDKNFVIVFKKKKASSDSIAIHLKKNYKSKRYSILSFLENDLSRVQKNFQMN